jgi:hypothetical protein
MKRLVSLLFLLAVFFGCDTSGPSQSVEPEEPTVGDTVAPNAPSNVAGEGNFYEVDLSWDGSGSEDVEGYNVYRSETSFSSRENASVLNGEPVGDLVYEDSSALDGVSYYYRITAVDDAGNESDLSEEVAATPSFEGDPAKGEELFNTVCAQCHASGNAWDLQAFAMPDTMVHRRALDHVNRQESFDIIKFIRSQDVEPFEGAQLGSRDLPPFQPGDRILSSDRQFAMEVFGQDQWPEDLKPEDLRGMDVSEIPIPFELPRWSVDHDESDWLPTDKLPSRIADKSQFRSAIEAYRSNPTNSNFLDVYETVHAVDEDHDDVYPWGDGSGPNKIIEVYELNRWISSFVAQHAIRKDRQDPGGYINWMMNQYDRGGVAWNIDNIHHSLISEMWVVGNIMRMHGPDSNVEMSPKYGEDEIYIKTTTVRWFYLAWMLNQNGETNFDVLYFPRLLNTAGYGRVAMFFAAHYIINSRRGVRGPYNVLVDIPGSMHKEWIPSFLKFAMDAYVYRIENGDEINGGTEHQRNHLKSGVERTLDQMSDKFTQEEKEEIRDELDYILNWLKDQEE